MAAHWTQSDSTIFIPEYVGVNCLPHEIRGPAILVQIAPSLPCKINRAGNLRESLRAAWQVKGEPGLTSPGPTYIGRSVNVRKQYPLTVPVNAEIGSR